MGNKYKGTFEVTIDGKEYTLRPSFDALCEFEDMVGISAHVARQQLIDGDFKAKLIPAAVWAGMQGEHLMTGQKIPSYRVLGEIMRKEGIFKYQVEAVKLLTYALSADEIIERIEAGKPAEEDAEKKS